MLNLHLGSSGTEVMQLQALLKKLGHDPGPIDGVYGPATMQAVRAFQRRFSLPQTGIVDEATNIMLQRFLLGYDTYTVRRGDTMYTIARKYRTPLWRILAANPGVNPSALRVGQQITVPYDMNIVDTNIDYTYGIMETDIAGLKARYPFLETGIAGKSTLGRNLYYIRLGTGEHKVFYNASHHALEWITSVVVMKFIEDFAAAYASGQELSGYSPADIWAQTSIYIMPMVNPDGVELVLNGLQTSNPNYNELIEWNNGSMDFSTVWQANNRGVDLNHNYNAMWEASKEAGEAAGITGPGPTRYSGPFPESEPEVRAVADFTRNHNFDLVLAYHSQGELIFWNFMNLAPPIAREIGEALAAVSGYTLAQAEGIASYAGYKDWFTQDFRRPGYTVEVGIGKNPLPIYQFDEIYADNLPLMLIAAVIPTE